MERTEMKDKLQLFGCYLNGKVEYEGEVYDLIGIDSDGGIQRDNQPVVYIESIYVFSVASIEDCTLLVRSFEDMKEGELKEFEDTFGKLVPMDIFQYANVTDWLRKYNFKTDLMNQDIVKKGWAKINNEAYK